MIRTTLAALGLAAFTQLTPVAVVIPNSASAQVTVNIEIGRGTQLSGRRRITCAEGASLLRRRGFRDIRRVDCRGRYFIYRASRGGRRFEVAVSARNGQIVDFRRVQRR